MKKCLLSTILALLIGLWHSTEAFAQQRVNGRVADASTQEPLPGVTVMEKGSSNGATTNLNGEFSIDVKSENPVLVFSFIGYVSKEEQVGNRSTLDVSLEEDVKKLEEVVVTAFGLEKEKKSLTYAVSEVGGEDVSTVKQTNVVNSLAGRVAGVVITQSTAGPGSGSRVVIRGNNSLTGNNQPLYVVDGVPIDNSGFGTAAGSGTGEYSRTDYGTGISDINPDDIESMSVLKGPNAAALYGSRAANGVIMITTKKGRAGKGLGVSYSANFTWENPLLLPDYQNEYGQGSEGQTYSDLSALSALRQAGGSWGGPLTGAQELYYTGEERPYAAQPDNVQNFFRTGSNAINTLALEGGNEKANMRFSYTNTSSKSIIPNSGLERHNFSLRSTAKLTDKLNIDTRISYFTQEAKNRATQGTEGIMAYVYNQPRNVDFADLQNYQNPDYSVRSVTAGGGNPYWILNNNINEDSRNRIQGYAKVSYEFTPTLSAFARVGTDYVNQDIHTVDKPGHWFFTDGRLNITEATTSETNADFLFMYNKAFNDQIGMSLNFGGNHRYSTYKRMGIYGDNFRVPTVWSLSNASYTRPSYTPLQEKKVNSLYGSAQFSYQNTFFLDLSARNDWSSALSRDNWSFFYPSVGVSLLMNEIIDPSRKVVDLWKLRSSWAQVGNDTDPYQIHNTFIINQDGYLGRTTMSRQSVLLSEDLRPEQISTYEIGTDVRFFKNRLYADVSYYHILSEDLIMDVPVAGATGYNFFRTNVGQMVNKGVELMIGGVPFQTTDFSWDVSLNLARNRNSLKELIEDVDQFVFTTTNSGTVAVQATVGGGFGDIYGTTYQQDPQGNIILDNSGRPIPTSERVLLGNYQPDWTGGLSNTLHYKNLSLRFLVDARIGGQLYSGTDAGLDRAGVSSRTLKYREEDVVLDGVVNVGSPDAPEYQPNDTKINTQQYWGSYSSIASNYIYNQTNIRLREASLNYNLPASLLERTPFKSGTFGLIGRNLFFLYKEVENFDPESSFSTSNFAQGVLFYNLPTTRQYGINLNLKF
jgi:TonB-linked SusC/RagA family outer membrane protein